MNCKPGDLALVKHGFPAENVGKIIRCIAIDAFSSAICDHDMWVYEGQLVGLNGRRSIAVADACLQPLRDPGADDIDQMVQRVGPAPTVPTPADTYALLAVFPGEEPAFYDADLRPLRDPEILQGVSHG